MIEIFNIKISLEIISIKIFSKFVVILFLPGYINIYNFLDNEKFNFKLTAIKIKKIYKMNEKLFYYDFDRNFVELDIEKQEIINKKNNLLGAKIIFKKDLIFIITQKIKVYKETLSNFIISKNYKLPVKDIDYTDDGFFIVSDNKIIFNKKSINEFNAKYIYNFKMNNNVNKVLLILDDCLIKLYSLKNK